MNFEAVNNSGITFININVPNANILVAPEFRKFILAIIESDKEKQLIVNFKNVNFVDSAFLAAMVVALKKITAINGDIKITNLQKPVRALFELTRLYKVFEIFEFEEDAVLSFI